MRKIYCAVIWFHHWEHLWMSIKVIRTVRLFIFMINVSFLFTYQMIRDTYNEFTNDLCDSFQNKTYIPDMNRKRDKTIFTNFLQSRFVLFGLFKLQMFVKSVAQQNYSTLSERHFCLEGVFAVDWVHAKTFTQTDEMSVSFTSKLSQNAFKIMFTATTKFEFKLAGILLQI